MLSFLFHLTVYANIERILEPSLLSAINISVMPEGRWLRWNLHERGALRLEH